MQRQRPDDFFEILIVTGLTLAAAFTVIAIVMSFREAIYVG